MTDIVERLRGGWEWPPSKTMEEAADEIERLTNENKELREYNSTVLDPYATLRSEIERLRAALQSIADMTDYGTETTTSRMTNVIHNANVIARAALEGK